MLQVLVAFLVIFYVGSAHAELSNAGILDNVLTKYQNAASGWATIMTNYATWLFWTLAVISITWTFGFMALRQADLMEFFREFISFMLTTGFFWWLLSNGPNFSTAIIKSLRQIGAEASGLGSGMSPSSVVDMGFYIFFTTLDQSSVWKPVDSGCGILIAAVVMVVLALVGVEMLLTLCAGWILCYGGVIFLGFGGSRWTSDMAISFYKQALGIGASLLGMVLIIGIGMTFLNEYFNQMSKGISIKEVGVMLVVAAVLYALIRRIPPMLAGLASGGTLGGGGGGGGGGLLAMAGVAGAAVAGGAALASAGASNLAGGASAIKAAFSAAQESMQKGTGLFAKSNDSGTEMRAGGGLSQAMGAITNSTAGKFAGEMGASLAKGAGALAKEKAAEIAANFGERASQSLGGRVAEKIRSASSGGSEGESDDTAPEAGESQQEPSSANSQDSSNAASGVTEVAGAGAQSAGTAEMADASSLNNVPSDHPEVQQFVNQA